MKWVAMSLASTAAILGIIYAAVGGAALAVISMVVFAITIIGAVFTLGVWYAHNSIQLGAKLAVDAQSSNDQWDTVKMQSLAQFGSEMIKLKALPSGQPTSGPDQDAFDASFTITGIGGAE